MNISSIVVKVKEERFLNVLEILDSSDYCEVHFHEKGKIVVTIEGDTTDEEIKRLKKIEALEGVLAAEMVYAYSEHELDSERSRIEVSESVPEWLNDENIKAHEIQYKGNIKI